MGTWGPGVFDDDLALDVQSGFRELIAAGYSPDAATDRLVAEYEFDDGSAPIAAGWIALAGVQWKTGRLLDRVRDRALEQIAVETPDAWLEPQIWKRRQKVLQRTSEMLRSPQRGPTKIRREPLAETPFAPGDLLRFTMHSGREVALWAMRNRRHQGLATVCTDTFFQLLAFGDPKLGRISALVDRDAPVLTDIPGSRHRYLLEFTFHLPQDAHGARWKVIDNVPFPEQRERGNYRLIVLRRRGITPDDVGNDYFQAAYEASLRASQ